MRRNCLGAEHLAKGVVPWTDYRRVVTTIEPEIFDLLRAKAEDEGSSVSAVAARLLAIATLATGPHA